MLDKFGRPLSGESSKDPIAEWLHAKGFIWDNGTWAIAWSCRSGIDRTTLEFYPLARHPNDAGWDAIIGHHASGTNPRLIIGRCETLADVQLVYDTIRRINGYPGVEPSFSTCPAFAPT